MQDEKSVTTFEMAELGRNVGFITAMIGFGTLWMVPEDIWQQVLSQVRYDRNSNRRCHPGCSVLSNSVTTASVPMLHGTSEKRGRRAVRVTGLTEPTRVTWFGGIPPQQIPFSFWKRAADFGRKIRPPEGKSFLAPAEMQAMRAFMATGAEQWAGRTNK